MKRLLPLLAFFSVCFVQAQVNYDFETDSTTLGFQYFESSLDGTPVPVIDNPNATGINESSKVLAFTRAANAKIWTGSFSNMPLKAPVKASSGGQICVDVHFDHIGSLALKLEDSPTDDDDWIQSVANTKVGEWETLCFDFDLNSLEDSPEPAAGNLYSTIVIFPDFLADAETIDVITYLDNITYEGGDGGEITSDITFRVDASDLTVGANGMLLSGDAINGWDANATPMEDSDGDDVWEVTVALPAGPVEYKFSNSGDFEVLDAGSSCTKTTDDFTNRIYNVGADDAILPAYIFASCLTTTSEISTVLYDYESDSTTLGFQYFESSLDGSPVPVIENPNRSGINESPTVLAFTRAAESQIYTGAFSSEPLVLAVDATNGGQLCVDVHFDHIGSLALKLEGSAEDADNWIFQVPNTKVGEWETLCFDLTQNSIEQTAEPAKGQYGTVVFFPDFLRPAGSVDTITYLDNITYDGAIVGGIEDYAVTFNVDMTNETVGDNGVFVFGKEINDWSADATPMTDDDGDGIYTVTVNLRPGVIEYKFVNSGTEEDFESAGSCNISDPSGAFINRLLLLEASDTIVETYFFNSCNLSTDVQDIRLDENLFTVSPNIASDFVKLTYNDSESKRITVVNANGQMIEMLVTPQHVSETILTVSDYASGIYFIRMDTPSSYGIRKMIVR